MANQDVRIIDVSAAPISIDIDGPITDFMDDGNPIEVSDTETANIEWSCNARMIRTVKPAAVMVSVTVVPKSDSDKRLWTLWQKDFSNGGKTDIGKTNEVISCTLSYENEGSITLTDGTCISGPAGPSVSGGGKMNGNTYTFAFETVNGSAGK